ncbi:hypothetical protein MXB_3165 [Myxobolus squamalis]|nr:hypothetical protein MXB_3165 [Myxobolus squamalis]
MVKIDWKCNIFDNLIVRDKNERDPFCEIYQKCLFLLISYLDDTLVLKLAGIKATGSFENNIELSIVDDALGNLKAEKNEIISKLRNEVQSCNIQNAKQETRISILLENIVNLKSDYFELKNELESIKKQKETIEEENRILNSTILKLQQKLSAIETENAELLSKYVKLIEDEAEAMNISNEKIWLINF